MSYRQEIQCSYCFTYGHNRRSCACRKKAVAAAEASLLNPEKELDYNERLLLTEQARSERQAAERKSVSRKCSYCNEVGHNRRTCKARKLRLPEQLKAASYIHRFCASIFRASGCVPGALFRTNIRRYDRDYEALPDLVVFGVLTKIHWALLGMFDPNKRAMPSGEVTADLFGRKSFLEVNWMLPDTTNDNDGGFHYKPSNSIALPRNILYPEIGLDARNSVLVGPVASSDSYEFSDEFYQGADYEGCPRDFVLRNIPGSQSAFYADAGIIFDDDPCRRDEILSFDERGH